MAVDSDNLQSALEESRPAIEHGLRIAEEELAALRARESELKALISRARAALGTETVQVPSSETSLHEALELVLKERDGQWMDVGELTDAVRARNLYRMRDGRPVEKSQVQARIRNYDWMFEKEGGQVRLTYRFDTAVREITTGAFEEAETRVTTSGNEEMIFVSRVTYSAMANERLDGASVAKLAEARARGEVADGGFKAGTTRLATLTSHGWRSTTD